MGASFSVGSVVAMGSTLYGAGTTVGSTTRTATCLRFRPRVRPLSAAPSPAQALAALRSHRGLALLDSAAGEPRRHSVLGFDPLRVESTVSASAHPIDVVEGLVARLEPVGGDRLPGPFRGGFLGAIAYDAGVWGEELDLPVEPWELSPLSYVFLEACESWGWRWWQARSESAAARRAVPTTAYIRRTELGRTRGRATRSEAFSQLRGTRYPPR